MLPSAKRFSQNSLVGPAMVCRESYILERKSCT